MVITVKHVALSTAALVAWNKVGAVVITVPIIHQALINICEWIETAPERHGLSMHSYLSQRCILKSKTMLVYNYNVLQISMACLTSNYYGINVPMHLMPASCVWSHMCTPRRELQSRTRCSSPLQASWSRKMGPTP